MRDISRRKALALIPAAAITAPAALAAHPIDPHHEWNRRRHALEAVYDIAEARVSEVCDAWPDWVNEPSVRFGDVEEFESAADEWAKCGGEIDPDKIVSDRSMDWHPGQMIDTLVENRDAPTEKDRRFLESAVAVHYRNCHEALACTWERARAYRDNSGYPEAEAAMDRAWTEWRNMERRIIDTPAQTLEGLSVQMFVLGDYIDDDIFEGDPDNEVAVNRIGERLGELARVA